MGNCGDARPTERGKEEKKKTQAFKLDNLAEDMPVAIVVFPGCIQGDRLPLTTRGNERAVLAYGTAEQIAKYAIGESVTIAKETYKRNVARVQEIVVDRVKQEMTGKGDEIEAIIKKQGGNFGGYTLTVNGENVTGDSILNSFFQELCYIEDGVDEKGKPILKGVPTTQENLAKAKIMPGTDKPLVFMGGVELVVGTIITPGSEYRA